MRPREEIEREFNDVNFTAAGSYERLPFILEVLLDIRDLLSKRKGKS